MPVTLAGSPKPRHNNGPKGASYDPVVWDQPMEMIDGRGGEQASKRRGEDAREDPKEGGSPRGGDGVTGIR